MQFFTPEKRNAYNALTGADPKSLYIPLNAGRRVGARKNKDQGSYLQERPADQVEAGTWIQARQNDGTIVPAAFTSVTAAADVQLNAAHTIYLADTSGGAYTLTLPPAADSTGRFLTVKKTDVAANAVTLDGNASETIDGAATNNTIDAQFDVMTIVSDGTEWHIVSSNIA